MTTQEILDEMRRQVRADSATYTNDQVEDIVQTAWDFYLDEDADSVGHAVEMAIENWENS